MKKTTLFSLLLTAIAAVSCTSHYQIANVSRHRILVDNRYDQHPSQEALAFLAPYKAKVDSVMSPVMGIAARDMDKYRPESEISNLLSDIMVWAGKDYQEKPDFGVYNIGGIRAALSKGTVTYGDINDLAPFENKIAFTTLTGEKVMELFTQIARRGGEGVSHSVRMLITKDGKLISATINGEPVQDNRDYRIATIDYLLGGTDKLESFKKCRDVNSPKESSNNSRFIIMNYFRNMQKQGKEVDAQIEGRIQVKE